MNEMRSLAMAAAAALVLAGCATLGPGHAPRQFVRMPLDTAEWTQVLHAADGAVSITEYVAPGETAEQWTRFVSVQVYSDAQLPYPGARPALSECRALLRATCPGAVWTVLRDGEEDALYEWRIAGCASEPDQHEVGRVMHGRGSWARISFSVKGVMDAATREEWIRRLEGARLVASPLGRTPRELNEYFSDLYFHGTRPPPVLQSERAVLLYVARTRGGIGYVSAAALATPEAAGVRVLLTVGTP